MLLIILIIIIAELSDRLGLTVEFAGGKQASKQASKQAGNECSGGAAWWFINRRWVGVVCGAWCGVVWRVWCVVRAELSVCRVGVCVVGISECVFVRR